MEEIKIKTFTEVKAERGLMMKSEVARLVGLTPELFHGWVRKGIIPGPTVAVGARVLYTPEDVEKVKAKIAEHGPPKPYRRTPADHKEMIRALLRAGFKAGHIAQVFGLTRQHIIAYPIDGPGSGGGPDRGRKGGGQKSSVK